MLITGKAEIQMDFDVWSYKPYRPRSKPKGFDDQHGFDTTTHTHTYWLKWSYCARFLSQKGLRWQTDVQKAAPSFLGPCWSTLFHMEASLPRDLQHSSAYKNVTKSSIPFGCIGYISNIIFLHVKKEKKTGTVAIHYVVWLLLLHSWWKWTL